MFFRILTTTCRFFLVLSFAVAAGAQEPVEEGPAAIPLANVAERADQLTLTLRRVETIAQPRANIAAIQQAIDEDAAAVLELKSKIDALDPDRVSQRLLADLRVEWTARNETLEAWMAEMQPRWETLNTEGADLAEARQIWEATRERALAEEAPPEIIGLIDSTIERIRAGEDALRERREVVASMMDRVRQGEDTSSESLDRLEEVTKSVRGRLLTRDAGPLWDWSSEEPQNLVEDASQARLYWWTTLTEFVRERAGRFLVVLVSFLGFFLFTLFLERFSAHWPADEASLDEARFVLSRKLSMSLAFAVLMVLFLFSTLVGPAQDLFEIIVVVPVIRLAAGLLPPHAALAVRAGAWLLLFNRVWSIPTNGSLLSRILLLMVDVAAIAAAVVIVRRWQAAGDAARGPVYGLARLVLYVAAVLLSVALVANVLGWTNLAEGLTSSVLESTFGVAGWTVVILAAMSLVPAVVRSPLTTVLPSLARFESQLTRQLFVGWCLVAAYFWGSGTIQSFQLTETVASWSDSVLSASVVIGGLEISVASIAGAALVLGVTWALGRLIGFALREEILPRLRLPVGADHSVVAVMNYVVWGSGILLAGAAAGLTGTQLTVVFGALGVGIGFGLQNVVGNFVSGLILIFERPIKVGDQVQTSTHFGVVTGIGIRASTIRTFDGAEVVVPNSDLVAKEFVNWTHTDMSRRVEVSVRVALGTDPRAVLEILRTAAAEHERTLDTPPPNALMTGFGESSLDFRLLVWTRVSDFLSVSSDLHITIKEELERAGIEIPVPRRDVEITGSGAEDPRELLSLESSTERHRER